MAIALVMIGSLSVAGQASAHGGGDVVGALLGGAVLGAAVTSVLNPAPVVVYQQPVYAQPVYARPAYQAPAYAGPPPGYCYDQYQRAYVACGAAPVAQYNYPQPPQPQPNW
jgi:hypothetical protein